MGRNTNGNDIEARTALPKSPLSRIMEFLLNTSDATALKGTNRLSKFLPHTAVAPAYMSTNARFICNGSITLLTIGLITVIESLMATWAETMAGVGGFCLK